MADFEKTKRNPRIPETLQLDEKINVPETNVKAKLKAAQLTDEAKEWAANKIKILKEN
ncbi:hypothetical protein ACFL3T_04395 [Patescibacteria group bacterium]